MKINIGELNQPGSQLEFSGEDPGGDFFSPEDGVRLQGPIAFEGRVLNEGQGFLLEGRVKATLVVNCDRCLEKFLLKLEAPFKEEYRKSPAAPAAEEDEVKVLEGDVIDLKPVLRETLLLALPMKRLCREDCKGLCPRCGHNLNRGPCRCAPDVDARLAPLQKLWSEREGGEDGST